MVRITIREKAGYLSDAVFAASDGVVTTFAVVAGSAGASLDQSIVLILGFANLFADGFSMAAGNFLGSKSEMEYERVKGKNIDQQGTPFKHGIVTFIVFNLAGLLPLLPFLLPTSSPFMLSTILVGVSLFVVGMLRSVYTRKNIIKSGIEMFTIGGFAAFVAFAVGYLIENIVRG